MDINLQMKSSGYMQLSSELNWMDVLVHSDKFNKLGWNGKGVGGGGGGRGRERGAD